MKNKKVFLPEYDKVEELRDEHDYLDTSGETFYLLTKNRRKGLAAKNENQILANQYDSIQVVPQLGWNCNRVERYFIVTKNNKMGVMMSGDRNAFRLYTMRLRMFTMSMMAACLTLTFF